MEFVCGFRALTTAARNDFSTLTQAASLLSCGMAEVPAVLGKLIEERRVQHGAVKRLEERLAEHEARELLGIARDRSHRSGLAASDCFGA